MRARLLTAALVVAGTAVALVPVAQASGTSTTMLTPAVEAWYQPNPTCALPTGCLTTAALPVAPPFDIPLSPFPAGTLHVASTGGNETARAFIGFPTSTVLDEVTAASLDVPLDTSATDGSQSPETAKAQVCLVTGALTKTEGGIGVPPSVSCDRRAPLTYVATPTPHLHADLAPLLEGLLTTDGLALLPDATQAAQTDAWHVVFSSHDRTDAAKTAPATLTLQLRTGEDEQGVLPPTDEDVGLPVVPPATGFTPAPAPATGLLPVQPLPPAQAPVAAPPALVPQTRTAPLGYAYPAVWLLPLAFLLVVPMVANALTKDLAQP